VLLSIPRVIIFYIALQFAFKNTVNDILKIKIMFPVSIMF
jgi:hypothetical protein